MEPEYEAAISGRKRSKRRSERQIRFSGIDIVKILALLLVICVHTFLHTGFYGTPITMQFGAPQIFLRWIAFNCVPLFMITTGFLMCHKTLSAGYYPKIIRVLVIYVVISLGNVIFNVFYYHMDYTAWQIIRGLFMYTDAHYGWYVEYYFTLFLLIPFINAAFFGLKNRKQRLLMVMTACFLFVVAPTFYVGNDVSTQIRPFPAFFVRGYPIAYYLIGAFVREYPPSRTRRTKMRFLLWFLIAWILLSLTTIYQSMMNQENGSVWLSWHYDDYGSWPAVLMSAMFFLLLFDIRIRSRAMTAVLQRLSNATYPAYLISFIFDAIFYKKLNATYPTVVTRFQHVIPVIAKVFACSMLSGLVIQLLYELCEKKAKQFIHNDRMRSYNARQ